MTKQDWHLTTTQLSALLDGQLSPEEQEQSDAHLPSCEQCQQQLASLRQTVALLRAMPQAQLPRSFVLPADSVVTPPVARSRRPVTPVPLPTSARRRAWPLYIHRTATALSTLAAVLGIVFLLSSLFGMAIHGGSSASSSSTNTGSSSSQQTQSPQRVTKPALPAVSTPHVQASAIMTPSPSPTATPASSLRSTTDNDHNTPLPNAFDLSMPGSRAIIGLILLVIGIVGLSLLALQRARSYP